MIENLLKLNEGTKLKPYKCPSGKLTIGVGRNLDDRGITEDEAMYLLRNDIDICVATLEDRIDNWSELDEVRRGALIDMTVNMGWPRLSKFVKFLAAVHDFDWDNAAIEMEDSRWWNQVGSRGPRIQKMILTGEWPHGIS